MTATALVTRPQTPAQTSGYLVLSSEGAPSWVSEPEAATSFPSMREAMRAAMRLPSTIKAYGLPRAPELTFAHAA